jgi:hypothetical protein
MDNPFVLFVIISFALLGLVLGWATWFTHHP